MKGDSVKEQGFYRYVGGSLSFRQTAVEKCEYIGRKVGLSVFTKVQRPKRTRGIVRFQAKP